MNCSLMQNHHPKYYVNKQTDIWNEFIHSSCTKPYVCTFCVHHAYISVDFYVWFLAVAPKLFIVFFCIVLYAVMQNHNMYWSSHIQGSDVINFVVN